MAQAVAYGKTDEVGYKADIESLCRINPELATLEQYLRCHGWKNPEPSDGS